MKAWGALGVVGLCVALGGCGTLSRSSGGRQWSSGPVQNVPVPPGPVVVVKDEVDTEYEAIEAEAVALFTARRYDEIENRARALRASKAAWVSGYWHLSAFYRGLFRVPAQAPEAQWQERVEALKAWTAARPKSVTARVALARAYYDGAWRARGDGWSSSVTDAMQKTVDERLALAAQELKDSAAQRKDCPGWFAASQRVAHLQGWDRKDYDALCDEAIAAFPTYLDFHYERLIDLLPRWHGRPGELEAYMANTADAAGGAEGDVLYAKLSWALESSGPLENQFKELPILWPRVQKGFQALLKQNPGSFTLASAYCVLATRAGDRATAQQLFLGPVGNKVDLSAWGEEKVFLRNRRWVFGG